LEQSSTTTLPSATGAVADGLARASDALGAASMVDIAAQDPELSTVDTLVQIERLRRQRQVLDAEIHTLETQRQLDAKKRAPKPAAP